MIKVNGETISNNGSTYDLDTLYLDKARESVKIVSTDNILGKFSDNVSWSEITTDEEGQEIETDMSDYSKCVFEGHDLLLNSYVVVMSKSTNEEDLEEIIEALS